MSYGEICFKSAKELSRMLHSGDISAIEVMTAFLSQIQRLNPRVNAICSFVGEEAAMLAAEQAHKRITSGNSRGPLEGFPHAVKDLALTAGIRTTFGSRIYSDFVPSVDSLIVERLKDAGAIIIGKTNVPEFGAGSQTFNSVFGATLNPYDLTRTCGGSSGGAAVALACGMVPLADGSDLGGSLRNPASFCNVVGLRPSAGRVPIYPALLGWNPLSVQGPMARSVEDVAFMLSVIAGPDNRSPIAINESGNRFSNPLQREFKGCRIAWSRDLGRYPVEPVVNEVCDKSREVFEALGCTIADRDPDLSDADEIFQIMRAWSFAEAGAADLQNHRELIKDTVVWNIEQGLKLSGRDVSMAEVKRTELFHRMRQFMEKYEFLVLPVSQVAPFSVNKEWIDEINGVRMETYIDWMATCYAITVTGLPAISVPCGFTSDGLPVGLQIVGRHQRDFDVLQLAHAFERLTEVGKRRPAVCEIC